MLCLLSTCDGVQAAVDARCRIPTTHSVGIYLTEHICGHLQQQHRHQRNKCDQRMIWGQESIETGLILLRNCPITERQDKLDVLDSQLPLQPQGSVCHVIYYNVQTHEVDTVTTLCSLPSVMKRASKIPSTTTRSSISIATTTVRILVRLVE